MTITWLRVHDRRQAVAARQRQPRLLERGATGGGRGERAQDLP